MKIQPSILALKIKVAMSQSRWAASTSGESPSADSQEEPQSDNHIKLKPAKNLNVLQKQFLPQSPQKQQSKKQKCSPTNTLMSAQ